MRMIDTGSSCSPLKQTVTWYNCKYIQIYIKCTCLDSASVLEWYVELQ